MRRGDWPQLSHRPTAADYDKAFARLDPIKHGGRILL
jgi:hypothetical protein